MKEKFYPVLSPVNLIIALLLDCGCAFFAYLSVTKLIKEQSTINIAFFCIIAVSSVIAVLSTIQNFKNGVRFYSDRVEFTSFYSENEFRYADIEKIESQRDTKVSFRKNFVDRFSNVIIYFKDDKAVTVSLGMTTQKTLNSIVEEIKKRIV